LFLFLLIMIIPFPFFPLFPSHFLSPYFSVPLFLSHYHLVPSFLEHTFLISCIFASRRDFPLRVVATAENRLRLLRILATVLWIFPKRERIRLRFTCRCFNCLFIWNSRFLNWGLWLWFGCGSLIYIKFVQVKIYLGYKFSL
jgi:hypothetical protein